jgi:glycerol-3-phosphate acyltransferase PlsX
MLACALFVLGRIDDVERPAIVTALPTPSGPLVLCDAGANVEPKPSQLAQFGVLGAAYDRVVHGRARPRLGLLANGAEPEKGTPLTRDAHARLTAAHGAFQFVGYVEGCDLFRGVVDVLATDGFTGNIVLKTCEGIAEGLFGLVRAELAATPRGRVGAALVAPALRQLARRVDYAEIGGAATRTRYPARFGRRRRLPRARSQISWPRLLPRCRSALIRCGDGRQGQDDQGVLDESRWRQRDAVGRGPRTGEGG